METEFLFIVTVNLTFDILTRKQSRANTFVKKALYEVWVWMPLGNWSYIVRKWNPDE